MMFGHASDPRAITAVELSYKLCELISRGYSSNGEKYRADAILYISLGIQQLLTESNRVDRIFYDNIYYDFVVAVTDLAERELSLGRFALMLMLVLVGSLLSFFWFFGAKVTLVESIPEHINYSCFSFY